LIRREKIGRLRVAYSPKASITHVWVSLHFSAALAIANERAISPDGSCRIAFTGAGATELVFVRISSGVGRSRSEVRGAGVRMIISVRSRPGRTALARPGWGWARGRGLAILVAAAAAAAGYDVGEDPVVKEGSRYDKGGFEGPEGGGEPTRAFYTSSAIICRRDWFPIGFPGVCMLIIFLPHWTAPS